MNAGAANSMFKNLSRLFGLILVMSSLLFRPAQLQASVQTPVTSFLLSEQQAGVFMYVRGSIFPENEYQVYLFPINGYARNEDVTIRVLNSEEDPWNLLQDKYQLGLQSFDSYVELKDVPQIFMGDQEDEFAAYIQQLEVSLTLHDQEKVASIFAAPQASVAVVVVDETSINETQHQSIPPLLISYGSRAVEDFLFPSGWQYSFKSSTPVLYEIIYLTRDPYVPHNQVWQSVIHLLEPDALELAGAYHQAKYLSYLDTTIATYGRTYIQVTRQSLDSQQAAVTTLVGDTKPPDEPWITVNRDNRVPRPVETSRQPNQPNRPKWLVWLEKLFKSPW